MGSICVLSGFARNQFAFFAYFATLRETDYSMINKD